MNHKNGNLALSLYVVEVVERRFGKCIGVKSKGTHEKVFFANLCSSTIPQYIQDLDIVIA